MTTVIKTSIGFYLPAHVSKSQWAKNNIHVFTKEKHMKPKWLTSIFEVLNKLVPGSPFTGQNLCLSNPLVKPLNTLGQKQYLASVEEKMFNPTLMNKLIRMSE